MYYTKDLKLGVVTEEGAKQLYEKYNDYWGRACCDSTDSFTVPETWDDFYGGIKSGGLSFLVTKREDGTVIGYGSLTVSYIAQLARPYIFISKEHRGKGYGTQLMAALVYIAFQEVNARKVSLVVYGMNQPGIHLYEKMGFKEEGRRLEEVYRDGSYWDVIAMGLFRKDWREYWKSLVQDAEGRTLYTISTSERG